MTNIFCTKKLESFLPIEDRTLESYTSDNNWNAQLLIIDRRKCIFFIHKRTLYSFVIFNLIKKDIKNLGVLFFDGLVNQLKSDGLYRPELDQYLKDTYSDLKVFKTDNDQSTLGTLRDTTMHLNSYIEDKLQKTIAAKYFIEKQLNRIPLGSRKFKYASELMGQELKTFL